MLAADLYAALDAAGLTPPVHYAAAPHEWRTALERVCRESTVEARKTERAIQKLHETVDELRDQIEDLVIANGELAERIK